MSTIALHANTALDNMAEPIKLHSISKAAAKKAKAPAKKPAAKKAKAPAKAPAKKAAAKKAPAAPKKGAKAAPDVQAILDKTDAAKKRLAARPKPEPKKALVKPKPKAKREGLTYKDLAANHAGKSSLESPVQAMWNLCDEMQDSRRKDVIAAAVERGIGYYTARTQYQLWLTAFRNS